MPLTLNRENKGIQGQKHRVLHRKRRQSPRHQNNAKFGFLRHACDTPAARLRHTCGSSSTSTLLALPQPHRTTPTSTLYTNRHPLSRGPCCFHFGEQLFSWTRGNHGQPYRIHSWAIHSLSLPPSFPPVVPPRPQHIPPSSTRVRCLLIVTWLPLVPFRAYHLVYSLSTLPTQLSNSRSAFVSFFVTCLSHLVFASS
jgi:hypothetical protein